MSKQYPLTIIILGIPQRISSQQIWGLPFVWRESTGLGRTPRDSDSSRADRARLRLHVLIMSMSRRSAMLLQGHRTD